MIMPQTVSAMSFSPPAAGTVIVPQTDVFGRPTGTSVATQGAGAPGAPAPAEASQRIPHAAMVNAMNPAIAINSDVVGWLHIPNTNMNTPILQHAQDNSYYLYRNIHRQHFPNIYWRNAPYTVTYLDFRTIIGEGWRHGSSRNMVLYGHNWTNLRRPFDIGNTGGHTMFGQLPSYTSIDFARANPHIYFSTPELEGVWRVFAVGYTDVRADFFYNNPNPNDEQFQHILNGWRPRTIFNFDVEVDTTDRILTLSTCTRHSPTLGANQRFVVVARLLRPGESDNDVVNVVPNPNLNNPMFPS